MVQLQQVSIVGPDSPSADTLFEGFTTLNTNIDLLTPASTSFTTLMPLTKFFTSFAQANLSSVTNFTIPASVLPGSRLVMRLTGPGPINFPGLNLAYMRGQYRNGYLNIVEVMVLEGEASSAARYGVSIQNVPLGEVTGLVFRQDTRTNAGLFESFGQFLNANAGSITPASEIRYSRLNNLEPHRQKDGFFYFEIRYFKNLADQVTARWRQRSNPSELPEAINKVDGYTPILIPGAFNNTGSGFSFGGLCVPATQALYYGSLIPGDTTVLAAFKSVIGVSKAVLFFPSSIPNPLSFEPGQPASYNPQTSVPGSLVDHNTVEIYTLAIP